MSHKADKKPIRAITRKSGGDYDAVLGEIVGLLDLARKAAVRTVNAVMTATYWEIGRRIVTIQQEGEKRAGYGKAVLQRLSEDLTGKYGRGFGVDNLQRFRAFYLAYPPSVNYATLSRKSGKGTQEKALIFSDLSRRFPLPWSHYVRLLSVEDREARNFYESESLRAGWSVRQLDRQISTRFFERTLLSRNKAAMLRKAEKPLPPDQLTPEDEIKDPYVLEFLGIKDEYSESDLEDALIHKLESFLLELGGDFAFVGRQRRLRVGDEWYRVDLIFFHRRLRCLVVIDLKAGKFTHADAGQMYLYLNYAREHWTHPGENPPVGLILCAAKDSAVAHYALEGLPNKVLAAEYRMELPDEKTLIEQLERTRRQLVLPMLKRKGTKQ